MQPNNANNVILNVADLSWRVADISLLNDISFEINKGSFVGVLGPNGAGKSSLLRCLYRYHKPSTGEVKFQGQDIWQIDGKEYAQKVAVVLQHTPQNFQLSVKEVVQLGALPRQSWLESWQQDSNDLVEQALEQVALSDKAGQDFDSLSGGEKQRAMIARAVVQQPEILIMDEPTSHLDVKYQIQIMELAKSLGITVIASFHDLNLAASLCTDMLLLKGGELVASGTPNEVITESVLSDIFDVCVQVTPHPQTARPHVTYFYGYVESGE